MPRRCFPSILLALGLALPAAAQPQADARVLEALTTLVNAQVGFDQKAMDGVLAPDYVEVSPVGDVDHRADVLGFYAPDQKPAGPPARAALDAVTTRMQGDTAITVARLTFTMTTPGGEAVSRAMRCTFVTHRAGGKWQIASAQFTPIRAE